MYKWIKKIKVEVTDTTNLRRKESPETIPLSRGMNFRTAIAAEGHCQILGIDSQKTGQFCRSHGITLEELKAFSAWINANDDIVPATQFRTRENELTQAVAKLSSDNLEKDKAIRRQENPVSVNILRNIFYRFLYTGQTGKASFPDCAAIIRSAAYQAAIGQ